MKYAVVLGRVFTLSIAELISVLEKADTNLGLKGEPIKIINASEEILIIETSASFDAVKLQKKLGGAIKILEIVDEIPKRQQDSINFTLKHYFKPSVLKKKFFKEYKGKIQFGVSLYLLDMSLANKQPANQKSSPNASPTAFGEPLRIGMTIKKVLTEAGLSVRLVLPEFNSLALASVVVTKNLLLLKGAEICIIADQEKIYTAKTLVVQDFEDYGRRDYQRPVRDEKQGMIPPKVAQIMLNLSGGNPNDTILDPFCGIGTIVQEGLLLGYKMLGSDINSTAIKGSQQNLEWFRNRYHVAPGKYHFETSNATKVARLLQNEQIKTIVTEGTLGPIYFKYPNSKEISQNFQNLEALYKECFSEFAKILPPKGKIVMCIPAYKSGKDHYEPMPSLDWALNLGYNLVDIISPAIVKNIKFLKLTPRKTAIYDRKDQVVAREIVIFEKV
jgi:tRNA G10  N-methylase Trm11